MDSNKENKKPIKEKENKTKENEEKKKQQKQKQQQQQQQQAEKKKAEPKEKPPKSIEGALNAVRDIASFSIFIITLEFFSFLFYLIDSHYLTFTDLNRRAEKHVSNKPSSVS